MWRSWKVRGVEPRRVVSSRFFEAASDCFPSLPVPIADEDHVELMFKVIKKLKGGGYQPENFPNPGELPPFSFVSTSFSASKI